MKPFLSFIVFATIAITSVLSCQQEPEEIRVSSISLSTSTLELTVGDQASLDATISPDNATNKEITWTSDNEAVATVSAEGVVKAIKAGMANITATTVDQGKSASCAVTVGYVDLVDLGLSVKWASFNLGASTPTEYGGYYQWAGTTDVSDTSINLDWDNCPYHTGSDELSGWKKYNTDSYLGTVDNKTVLEPKDDAATVALGGKWRMPTDEEWTELSMNCSLTWTTIDGVNGYKVQSKMPGYTDNWIFLPAAGCRSRDGLYYVGSYGYYWSSSLNTDNPNSAYSMSFSSGYFYRSYYYRFYGFSVRPVSE